MKQELHFDTPVGTEVRKIGQSHSGKIIGYTYDPDSIDSSTDRPNVLFLVKEPWGPIHTWSQDDVILVEDE